MDDKKKSYRNTAIIALTTIVNISFSIIKNKVLALLIGPSGIGRFSILNDAVNFAGTMASLGVSNSGVQAVSEAKTKSPEEVRKVYNSLIYFFSWLSIGVIILFFIVAPWISDYLVQSDKLIWPLRIASLAIIFKLRSAVQNALVIGLQQIKMLAKARIYSGPIVTVASIFLVYFWDISAVPYLVILIPAVAWVISVLQARKLLKKLPILKNKIPTTALRGILVLGVATIYGGLLENIVNIIAKGGILRVFSEKYLGYYQVAVGFTLSYIGFITSSISSDYYPRLVEKVPAGHTEVNSFVNTQIGISMHLIMPILLTMLSFSEYFIVLLFSESFLPANDLISYSVSGTLITVISWPIAFVFLAHRSSKTYFITEFIGNGSHLLLILGALYVAKFELLGLAYVLHYIIYLVAISLIFHKFYSGSFTRENYQLFTLNVIIIAIILLSKHFLTFYLMSTVSFLLIGFMFYRGRDEYLLIFQSIMNKKNG